MCAIALFSGEDVSRIDLPGNVLNLKSVVLPLTNQVFAKLDVSRCLQGNVVRPLDAHFIVVVKDCRGIDVGNNVTCVRDAAREIAEVNDLL